VHLAAECAGAMGDTLRNKKAFRRGRIIVFVIRFCFHPFQKELPVFWERNKREDHFGFVVRFTISRLVITCTVREFNKSWIRDAQPGPTASLRTPLEVPANNYMASWHRTFCEQFIFSLVVKKFIVVGEFKCSLTWRMPSSGMWRGVDLEWTIFRVEKSASEKTAWAGGWRWRLQVEAILSSETSVHADLSTLKMEGMCSSETSVITRSTRHHIPEDGILHSHRRENLKFYVR
jgi:hypothetical protein